jgi:hypothetical protein
MAVCLLLGVAVGIVIPVYQHIRTSYQHIRTFLVEDSIHGTFFPVANALYAYQHDHGRPADSLAALVPKYIGAIPSSTLANSPNYEVLPDGRSWELVIRSRALSQPRLYICRSTQHFTPDETGRIILQYHSTWTVFPADM